MGKNVPPKTSSSPPRATTPVGCCCSPTATIGAPVLARTKIASSPGPWPEAWSFTYEDDATPTPQSPQAHGDDGGGIQTEYGITRRKVYFLTGQAVAVRRIVENGSTNLLHIHADHLGSNSVMSLNNGGDIVNGSRTRYLPFGAYRTAPTQPYTDRGFTGQQHNDNLGLIYYNARYYLPSVGRFLSADTIVPDSEDPESFNRYAYTRNNPLKYVDPSGHCWGFASGLRNTFYQTTCQNIDAAVSIIRHTDASAEERALAVAYIGVEALAHGTAIVGTGIVAIGCLTGGGTVVCATGGSAITAASSDGDPTNEVQRVSQVLCADGDCTNEARGAAHVAKRTIDFLADNANTVNHIMQPKHAWNRLINLGGNRAQDYQAIQPYLQQAVDNGLRTLLSSGSNVTAIQYVYTIEGETIILRGIELTNSVFQISDAWVRTVP